MLEQRSALGSITCKGPSGTVCNRYGTSWPTGMSCPSSVCTVTHQSVSCWASPLQPWKSVCLCFYTLLFFSVDFFAVPLFELSKGVRRKHGPCLLRFSREIFDLKLVQPLLLPCASLNSRAVSPDFVRELETSGQALHIWWAGYSGSSQCSKILEMRELVGPMGANPLSRYPTAPLALGCGSGESLQGIDCQRNKSKARVKCNNHVRGKKLEKYTTGSLNSYLVDKLLIETHYSSVPDSQKCLSCLEDHNKTGCLLCLPLILMEKDRALCNKV